MTLYVSSLLIACGICLFAGLQSLAAARRSEGLLYLAFGGLSVLVALYMLLTAALNQSDQLATANDLTRAMIALACVIYPVAVLFVSLYTGLRHWRSWTGLAIAAFGALFVLNASSPYGLLYADIARHGFIRTPWGEQMTSYEGTLSSHARFYYAAVNATYLWAIGSCIALWRSGNRARAWPMTVYMLVQAAAAGHAEYVYHTGKSALTSTPLAFVALVLLMGDALRRELRTETRRRLAVEADLRHRAYHDPLTGLPNRQRLVEQLQDALHRVDSPGCVLVLLNLHKFRAINEALGHDMGDQLLNAVANRLRQLAPAQATLARVGSDEFALLLERTPALDPQQPGQPLQQQLRQLVAAMNAPFQIGDHELAIAISAGVAQHPGTSTDPQTLLRQASMALQRAKADAAHGMQLFEPAMQAASDRRQLLENGLRLAIDHNELELHLQPQVDMRGRFIGAEALLRWRHPQHGQIEPSEFIAIAEESGLIHAIGREILHRASALVAQWPPRHAGRRLSLNVSPWQLFAPDFVRGFEQTVATAGADPARLTLEITENAFLHDLDDVADKIRALTALGFRFALDDFGAGLTTLESLKRLPVHELKIDRVFVETLHPGQPDRFVEAMIAIAHHLGLWVVAEGVESESQRLALAELGCDAIQGYLVSRPLPPDAFAAWLLAHPDPD